MTQLRQERLKELLHYNPETGHFTHKQARGGVRPGRRAGYKNGLGYIQIRLDKRLYYGHRLAWLYVHGTWPADNIDHINGNPDDNRLSNLREATQAENLRNKRIQSNCKSGIKGVSWSKKGKKWIAQIRVNGEAEYLGYFNTKEDAAKAYAEASARLHGEFSNLGGDDPDHCRLEEG